MIIFLIVLAGYLVINLANFQFFPRSVRQEMERRGSAITSSTRRIPAERGLIYDRDGEPLAFNTLQYRVGVSPSLVADALGLSRQLALILDIDEFEIHRRATSDNLWEFIAGPISADQGQAIAALDEISVDLEKIPKRFYPQGPLAGHVIGFVVDEELKGAMGVEGAYNDTLAGRVLDLSVSNVPIDLPEDVPTDQRGQDILLTLDRDVQFWVESELERAVLESGAFRGSAIVMDPRNGDILAMANDPTLDPNIFLEIEDPNLLLNPSINEDFEPGSIVQALTVAAGLETGAITPYWTYNDEGNLDVGGYKIWNRRFQTHGTIDVSQILVRSVNVGAATIALEMGMDDFYSMMRAFGLGQITGVDLFAEESGELKVPGDSNWSESYLGLNSYGQRMKATPLQMITAFAAIANNGIMRQPRIVRQAITEDGVQNAQAITIRRVISEETASIVTDLLVQSVTEGAPAAQLPGYTIAGKAGTARIATALDYEVGRNSSIVTFIGFLPADDPQVVVMVKLDRPDDYYGYEVAAPVFRRLADRLVILLEIPVDEVRHNLARSTRNISSVGS
ncbi:MAG: penicillin-binding protein 2 [Chloroflexi bacterium]|nr:penicillin-binding protein 2 [Chloroflexota bacterium]